MAGSMVAAFGIGVADMARSVDFYTRVLGLKAMQTFDLPDMDEVIVGRESGGRRDDRADAVQGRSAPGVFEPAG